MPNQLSRKLGGFAALRRFAGDDRGLAIVEFAFVLPLMLLLYLGSVAVTMGVTTDRKLTLLARSLGDIVAQDTYLTSDEATDVFAAARSVMSPYDVRPVILSMRVSSVKIKADGKACVRWSRSPNAGYARTPGDDITAVIPTDLRTPNTYLVLPEVKYLYKPVISSSIFGNDLTLQDILFMRPRQSDEVTTESQTLTACA